MIALIEQGRLDDAERARLELEHRFHDTIDWLDRTGLVLEARGDVIQAIAWYWQCIDFIEDNPDDFDAESRDFYKHAIEQLQLLAPTSPTPTSSFVDTPK